ANAHVGDPGSGTRRNAYWAWNDRLASTEGREEGTRRRADRKSRDTGSLFGSRPSHDVAWSRDGNCSWSDHPRRIGVLVRLFSSEGPEARMKLLKSSKTQSRPSL